MAIAAKNDLTIYERFADRWWDPLSPQFRSLHAITPHRLKLITRWCAPFSGKTIVDIGCGGGLLSLPLANKGARVIGVDLSRRSLSIARSMVEGDFIQGDARFPPLQSDVADIVILADVLDHIANYHEVLKETWRVLRPGGLVYINTINRSVLSWLLAIKLGEGLRLIPPGTHDHALFIRPEELQHSAEKVGFKLREVAGECPHIRKTLRNWAIHFRATKNLSVAYSALLKKGADES